jgi:NAD(P)H dehydrogenase (quinone)
MNHILVTGASGTIGSALIETLRNQGADFAVMSSRKGIPGAVFGDFAVVDSLKAAFAGVDTLFLLLPLVPDKLQLAANAVAAAQAAGVRHIVRSSGAGADAQSLLSLGRLQGQIDDMVVASGIPCTLLRPVGFMQNWIHHNAGQVRAGTFHAPHGDAAQSMVDVRDIAEAAAVVLADPAAHAGRAYTLTGDDTLTSSQVVAVLSAATGREIRYVDVPETAAVQAMTGMGLPAVVIDWLMSLNHAIKQGWTAGTTDDVQRLTGHPPRRFVDFAAEHRAAWL